MAMESTLQTTPATGALTVHPDNEQNTLPVIQYSDAAKKYINFRRQRMIAARDVRDAARDEYDGMDFIAWYQVQKRADDQYVAPRKNKTDTSINTGTIRDKDTSLVEYAMKYDFEPVAQAYDDTDEMLEEVAETAEDLVRKSFMLEEFKTKAKLFARSQVAFGVALIEDAWVERWTTEKTFGTTTNKAIQIGSLNQVWTEKQVKKYEGCQAKLWDLRKCYPGDIRKFFMNGPQGQPFFFTVEYESYDVVETLFGDWDRWKFVPNVVLQTQEIQSATVYNQGWSLRPISTNYVEIIRYYDPVANEYAITLNGVDMLPIMEKETTENGIKKTLISGFPLTAVSPSGAIPFAKFDLEPMHECFYSKSQPAKMRILGDIENMWFKALLGMMKQRWKPTMGNKSGKNFGQEVTDPAQIINDIREGDLFPILPDYKGAQPADISFYELIKKEEAKNSVEDSWQGIDNQGSEMTATQDLNNQKSQSLKVAALFDGLIAGYSQLFWLRTFNIIKNWTKPIDMRIDTEKKAIINMYRTITVPTEGIDGEEATKKIIFTKDTPKRPKGKPTLADSQALHQKEIDMKKNTGKSVIITELHPELFASMPISWYYCCIPVINETDPLAYMIFAKQIGDAIAAFGPDALNVKKLKYRFAKMTGQKYDTWFVSEQEMQQKQQAMAEAAAGGAPGTGGQASGGGVAPAVNNYTAHGAQPGARPTIAKAAQGARPQIGTIMK